MDNIHETLFDAYTAACSAIVEQIVLMAQDNDPAVQLDRATVVCELAQAVSTLAYPVTAAIDQMYRTHPIIEVSAP